MKMQAQNEQKQQRILEFEIIVQLKQQHECAKLSRVIQVA